MLQSCDRCRGELDRLGVCAACGRHTPLSAWERVGTLTASFEEQDANLAGGDPLRFEGYPDAVDTARRDTGLGDAVVWGWGRIEDADCALVVFDFRFMGGSMGAGVGEKVSRALDGARERGLPLVAVTASGGARMQEGMVALVQMAKTAEARRRHMRAGLAQLTLLTSPTTGGVYASFASLADVILAEPGATVGFAGPRVVKDMTGVEPAPDVHTAEYAFAHGLVDSIVTRADQAASIARVLRSLTKGGPGVAPLRHVGASASPRRLLPHPYPPLRNAGPAPDEEGQRSATPGPSKPSAWERLQIARDPARPKARAILDALLADSFELRGDRAGNDDPAIVLRLGALQDGTRVLAIGQDASGDGRIRPSGYRKTLRAIELAGRLRLPLLTLIDTRGADPLPESEAAGVASAIAHTFLAMLQCPSPTLAVVSGEGGSGGALAMAPADCVLAWEHAVFSVIAPEGAASILYRDPSRGPELADRLGITSPELVRLGIVDDVVPEPDGGAQSDPAAAIAVLGEAIRRALGAVALVPAPARLGNRRRRWRRAGGRSLRLL